MTGNNPALCTILLWGERVYLTYASMSWHLTEGRQDMNSSRSIPMRGPHIFRMPSLCQQFLVFEASWASCLEQVFPSYVDGSWVSGTYKVI